jgi:hypothetical protein
MGQQRPLTIQAEQQQRLNDRVRPWSHYPWSNHGLSDSLPWFRAFVLFVSSAFPPPEIPERKTRQGVEDQYPTTCPRSMS